MLLLSHNSSASEIARDPAAVLGALEYPYYTLIALQKSRGPHYVLRYRSRET